MKALDLIGQRFGMLVVVQKGDKNKYGHTQWVCRCDCGGSKTVPTGKITTNHTKSCGCIVIPSYDLFGKRYGRLTATRRIKNSIWECVCDCGNVTVAPQRELRSGRKKSCGCRNGKEYLSGFMTCTGCREKKAIDEFYRDKYAASGIYSQCKACKGEKSKEWHCDNPKYHLINYQRNPERARKRTQKWRESNPERYKRSYLDRHTREMGTVVGRLNNRMSSSIRRALRTNKGGRHWESLVGYPLEKLKRHIEDNFAAGMSWDALMRGEIHIDHKIPKAAFNYETPEDIDFKKCWSLKNLCPLWAFDNKSKCAKLNKPFQPSLSLEI